MQNSMYFLSTALVLLWLKNRPKINERYHIPLPEDDETENFPTCIFPSCTKAPILNNKKHDRKKENTKRRKRSERVWGVLHMLHPALMTPDESGWLRQYKQ